MDSATPTSPVARTKTAPRSARASHRAERRVVVLHLPDPQRFLVLNACTRFLNSGESSTTAMCEDTVSRCARRLVVAPS